jgi:hypothetical protein
LAFFVADWTALRRCIGYGELRAAGIANESWHGDSKYEKRGAGKRRA